MRRWRTALHALARYNSPMLTFAMFALPAAIILLALILARPRGEDA